MESHKVLEEFRATAKAIEEIQFPVVNTSHRGFITEMFGSKHRDFLANKNNKDILLAVFVGSEAHEYEQHLKIDAEEFKQNPHPIYKTLDEINALRVKIYHDQIKPLIPKALAQGKKYLELKKAEQEAKSTKVSPVFGELQASEAKKQEKMKSYIVLTSSIVRGPAGDVFDVKVETKQFPAGQVLPQERATKHKKCLFHYVEDQFVEGVAKKLEQLLLSDPEMLGFRWFNRDIDARHKKHVQVLQKLITSLGKESLIIPDQKSDAPAAKMNLPKAEAMPSPAEQAFEAFKMTIREMNVVDIPILEVGCSHTTLWGISADDFYVKRDDDPVAFSIFGFVEDIIAKCRKGVDSQKFKDQKSRSCNTPYKTVEEFNAAQNKAADQLEPLLKRAETQYAEYRRLQPKAVVFAPADEFEQFVSQARQEYSEYRKSQQRLREQTSFIADDGFMDFWGPTIAVLSLSTFKLIKDQSALNAQIDAKAVAPAKKSVPKAGLFGQSTQDLVSQGAVAGESELQPMGRSLTRRKSREE